MLAGHCLSSAEKNGRRLKTTKKCTSTPQTATKHPPTAPNTPQFLGGGGRGGGLSCCGRRSKRRPSLAEPRAWYIISAARRGASTSPFSAPSQRPSTLHTVSSSSGSSDTAVWGLFGAVAVAATVAATVAAAAAVAAAVGGQFGDS